MTRCDCYRINAQLAPRVAEQAALRQSGARPTSRLLPLSYRSVMTMAGAARTAARTEIQNTAGVPGAGYHRDARADLPGQPPPVASRALHVGAVALRQGFELIAAIVAAIIEIWHRSFLSSALVHGAA